MSDLTLDYYEIKNLFNKYSLDTLESLNIILNNVKKYDIGYTKGAYIIITQKKYEQICNDGNFEGRNEYMSPYNTFNLSEIKKSIDSLNKEELIYFKNIFEDALINIPDKIHLEKIKKEVKDMLDIINNVLDDTIELSNNELKILFNKYNLIELDALYGVFKYVRDYDMKDIYKIASEVYEEKEKEAYSNYEVPVIPNNFCLVDIANKNDNLTKKELEFLYKIVEDASFFLTSVSDLTNDIDENFIDSLSKLEMSLYNELERRENLNIKLKILKRS